MNGLEKSLDDDGLKKKQPLSINRPESLFLGPEPNEVGKTSPAAERGLRDAFFPPKHGESE
jgi:hypothetical protein